jgi:hypothetical protein
MPLTIKGKSPVQISHELTAERLASYPPHVPKDWLWHEMDPGKQAALCNDRAEVISSRLNVTRSPMKRLRFLEKRLKESQGTESPERSDALLRANQYRYRVQAAISEIILYESWGAWAWADLTVAQRTEFGCDVAWKTIPDRPSLIGIVWEWPDIPATFGPGFDLKAFMGEIPDLRRGIPFRHDIKAYIDLGWLEPASGDPEFSAARKNAQRTAAIAHRTKDKTYGT